MVGRIDPLRVVQDPAYAAGLSDAHWRALALDPAWNELVGEFHEMVAPVLERYGDKLGVPAPEPVQSTPAPGTDPGLWLRRSGRTCCPVSARPSRTPAFSGIGRRPGSYAVVQIRGSHSAASSGWHPRSGTTPASLRG